MIQPVGFTMGDAAGIGPEIIVKAFTHGLSVPAIVFGDVGAMERAARQVGTPLPVQQIGSALQASGRRDVIEVVQASAPLPTDLPLGQVSAAAGRGAYDCLCRAIDAAMAGEIHAIVTAPLNKHSMHLAGIDQPGHTEILAERSGTKHYAMMLANDELRVLLVTIHMALADVPAHITREAELRAIRLAERACRQMGIAHPRIAVAGLNPHAGEDGKFGCQDRDEIAPAVAEARTCGIDASGPWPGDTIFMRARRGEFDIVVAQYHDQGLIPVKYLGIDHGVNVTVGLPFVRTSVDHGTAFDIAGQGVADARSLLVAFDLALAMTPG
ncbi:4-hydroxythreonine-4-phosphate dehydrogenase PdxA [Bordetella holmesii]|uniref:4-hydroxythreonine-4-phosphate dehydrogenase PdxA n=2 Tax=Bordetella holmesii TaxID=35814 RepID=A0A158M139_9BORD|nr:4-hydroxythreonine-4-phosphate dehydrogenase PdxA [Bordetella holmesii]AHV92704.1 4-hydroxythreonine-4-phosphate dehydrogenase PdxA [Bordetella holmesii ATCC 51541]AIT27245.1 4-hydroxythreonine-4-phosphate dehydrogenase PdxA [Bordetella holmesii 44057]EWM43065.1 4-hydroxythreonine-4-phosphate dehydrogenase PdxA [Bordetella holmesii 41130]EWM47826.1 4-hydroxythreonine-4-phosphate dehydrogenase PdxA [Bordetella holmesii 35009]EWM51993.1 4-hydroxythreonine-4-phosphate dehydrogenase PdxA [Borde